MLDDRFEIQFVDNATANLIKVAGVSELDAFRYDRKLNDVGKLGLGLIADSWVDEVMKTDTLMIVRRLSPLTNQREVEGVYVLRDWESYIDETQTRYAVFGGFDLNHLLTRRMVFDDTDPSAAGGYITRVGEGSQVIRDYIYYQLVSGGASSNRVMPDISVFYDGDGEQVGGDYDIKTSLIDAVQEMAARAKVMLQWEYVTGRTCKLHIGKRYQDRSATTNVFGSSTIFAEEFGNMIQPRLVVQRAKEVNFIYAIGQGTPATRLIQEFTTVASLASAWNRMEGSQTFDRKDELDSLYLATGATEFLQSNRAKVKMEFDIASDVAGAIYKSDWDLGDIVTARIGSTQEDFQVEQVTVEYSNGDEQIKIKLGEQPL